MLAPTLAALALFGTHVVPNLAPMVVAQSGIGIAGVRTFDHLRAVAYAGSPVGSIFAMSLEDGSVKIIDAGTQKSTFTLTGHPRVVLALAFSPDGKRLATGDESARLFVWDTTTGALVKEFSRDRGHTRAIQSISWNANGTRIATIGQDDMIKVWDMGANDPVGSVAGNGANLSEVIFGKGGGLFASTLQEGMRIFNEAYAPAGTFAVGGGQGANGIAINRAFTTAATAGRDGRIVLWNLSNRQQITAIQAHQDWIIHAEFAPNGRTLATSSIDMSVAVWDTQTYQLIARIPEMAIVGSPLAFTGDGKFLITANAFDQPVIHQITPPLAAPAPPAPAPRRRR